MAKVDIEYHKLLETILEKGYLYDDPNREEVKRLETPSYTFRHEFKDGFPAITTKKLHYKNIVTELLWFLKGDTNIKYLVDNECNIWNKDAYNYYLKSRTNEKYNNCYCGHTTDCECGTASIENFIDGVKNESGLGDLGSVYGKQWRNFNGIDQIKDLIRGLKDKPLGTEHIVMAWNPADKPNMALPPCHYGFQVVVRPLTLLERSNLRNFRLGQTISDLTCDNQNIPKYGFELHWQQRSVDTFLG